MSTSEETKLETKITKKFVLVGADGIGKTSLLQAALQGKYPPKEHPYEQPAGVYECATLDQDAREIQILLRLWDTPGPFEWNRLEVLKYPHASVIVVAYAIDWPASFDLVEQKWLPELDYCAPGVPIILVGLRKDKRDDDELSESRTAKQVALAKSDGSALARKIGALSFVECSSFTGEGVREVFVLAARAALWGPKRMIVKEKKRRAWSRRETCVLL